MKCAIKTKGRGMSKSCPCMRECGHSGPHRPDLTGLEYPVLTVLRPLGVQHGHFKWEVKHKFSGKIRKVYHHDLVAGRTGTNFASGGGSGITTSKPPEYVTIISHIHNILNPRARQYKFYRGMPVYKEWNFRRGGSPIKGYYWLIENLGKKPGPGWSLDIIMHSAGFVPGNLRWVPPASSLQSKNQNHRTIFSVSDKVFSVEAKRRGYVKESQ